jgi:transcriptional regulator with XRE-family HTH domain
LSFSQGNAHRGFGRAVRHYRLAKELTQEDLAHLAGLHVTAISKIESGQRDPRFSTVGRVAKGLEIPRWQLDLTGELFERELGELDGCGPEAGAESP